jgi:adenosylcobyric acid synthase
MPDPTKPRTPAIMLQGTGSDVGKSVLVAGLCRLFANRGYRVRPFKPQNMSNNAAVTADGGEIGRAQALQAVACRVPASVHMNPVLLKPESDRGAQLVVQGVMRGSRSARDYQGGKQALLEAVLDSYARLSAEADLIIVEGAGSPAEINLRPQDIANMGFARAADVPVVLVGDIDRGGVIASLVGTKTVIAPDDAAMIRGFIVNKFRGDPRLFDDGYAQIATRTGWRGLGVIPWLPMTTRLPAEDAVALQQNNRGGSGVVIAIPMLSRIANFDDFDSLRLADTVDLRFVPLGQPIPVADLIILPGTKSTIADLAFLRTQGWDIDIAAHHRRGGAILGICGGYQMLGRAIHDPDGIDGNAGSVKGLGLLDIETIMRPAKHLGQVEGMSIADAIPFSGYEMHVGETSGADCGKRLLIFSDGRTDGAVSPDGRVSGCYVHGLFADGRQCAAWLGRLGVQGAMPDQTKIVDDALDALAEALARHVDIAALMEIAGLPSR